MRRSTLRTGLILSWLLGLMVACDDLEPYQSAGNNPTDNGNTEDTPSGNGVVLTAVKGNVVDGKLSLTVSLKGLGSGVAKGTLDISLIKVDGSKEYATQSLAYTVNGTEGKDFVVDLPMVGGVKTQADWVLYNVKLADRASGGLHLIRSLQQVLPTFDVQIEGPATVVQDRDAAYRIKVRDPKTRQALKGVDVEIRVISEGEVTSTSQVTTDERGDAVAELVLPSSGSYSLEAKVLREGTTTTTQGSLSVRQQGAKVLLTTDKPIYQPGQLIHLRALALDDQENKPLASRTATFEVEDGKGNKILKKTLMTDAHGIVSTDFRIGSIVNMGTFKVRAIVGEYQSEKTVKVSKYALPKFKIGVATDQGWYKAGQKLNGTLDVGYFFGKPVSLADVKIEASTLDVGETVFKTIQGKTDSVGHFAFSLNLPNSLVGLPIDHGNALVNLKITVTDTAGQMVTQERLVTVSQTGLDVVLVPEATTIVPGIENLLDLFASDPLGEPTVAASVVLTLPDGNTMNSTTDTFGHTAFLWTPPVSSEGYTISAKIQPNNSPSVTKSFGFTTQTGQEHVVVRTDKAVYQTGDLVDVKVITSVNESTVYVDWIHDGQTIDMRTLQANNGEASFTMPLDAAMLGSNRVEAYVVQDDGIIVRSGRSVFARKQGTLNINTTTDKSLYAPGEEAKLSFLVVDEQGNPAVAALGVQIVDEAVFALVDAKPGLLRTYFELESDLANPTYEIQGPATDWNTVLYTDSTSSDSQTANAAQKKAAASFSALGDKLPTGISAASWDKTKADSAAKLAPFYEKERTRLSTLLTTRVGLVKDELIALGCSPDSWDVCPATGEYFGASVVNRLRSTMYVLDFWGSRYSIGDSDYMVVLTTMGPDETVASADDYSFSFYLYDYGINGGGDWGGEDGGSGAGGGANAGGSGGGAGSSGAAGTGGTAGGSGTAGESGPKVRKDFPETLYVNPSLITGADGKAEVSVPMADSITTWRVSTLAHSDAGKLGGNASGITVFQDFFVDISFPATLTRGDEVTFPVAVYNYLDQPQSVTLQIQPASWYTLLGSPSTTVDLGAGEVKGVQIPIRVETVGLNSLTVKALGTEKSDAVARMVQVVPDGKEIALSESGSLGGGSTSVTAQFPADAILGSQQMHLDIYPAYLSEVVSGMDSILQTPNGCFEQTTSTTWPNVLVTRYMLETDQITPEIQMKAEGLISTGYQRLLTFEHPGGGFSWFGTSDPAPFLSVTAFGLMEFADMSKVQNVDEAMIARTADWLVSKQKGDGSWEGDVSEFFSFQTSTVRNTAFVAWSLASAGFAPSSVESGLSYVKSHIDLQTADSYTLGVVANAMVLGAPNDAFTQTLLDRVEQTKQNDGDNVYWSGDTQTSFYGTGQDADVTSTALITHALLLSGGHGPTVGGALSYLSSSRDSYGNFGSTQATIWTLRTLLLAATKGTEGAVGTVQVNLDNAPFATVPLTADQFDVMHLVDMSSLATVGQHKVDISFVGTGKFSYNFVTKHNIPWANTDPTQTGPIGITIEYDKTSLYVDETVLAKVTLVNNTNATQNMILATLGIPPGFEVVTDDLQAYVDNASLSRFETTAKQLDLYVTQLPASSQQVYQYHLRATMPVNADSGPAKVFPYYEPDAPSVAQSTVFTVLAMQ